MRPSPIAEVAWPAQSSRKRGSDNASRLEGRRNRVSLDGGPGWREWLLGEVEAVGHVVGRLVAGVDRGQAKGLLAELHQAGVRVLRVRDVRSLCVRAQDQACDSRPIGELRPVRPFLDHGRRNVVVPTTPIVPGDEDNGIRPESTLDDGIELLRRPFLAGLDRLDRMLAQSLWTVEPGHGWQFAGRGIRRELLGCDIVLAALQRRDVSL